MTQITRLPTCKPQNWARWIHPPGSATFRLFRKQPEPKTAKPKGVPPGHEGHRRQAPVEIIRFKIIRSEPAQTAICRSASLANCVPAGLKTFPVTEHMIDGYCCRKCRKTVEPAINGALLLSSVGLHPGSLSSLKQRGIDPPEEIAKALRPTRKQAIKGHCILFQPWVAGGLQTVTYRAEMNQSIHPQTA